MLRAIPVSVYLLLLLLSPSLQAATTAGDVRPPNILLLLVDDMGYNDSGLYQDVYGQTPVASMPALENLAQQGVRFSRFYTESTCSASRVALLTGQYPARHGFIPAARGISPDVLTLPEYLRSQGYATHHVGKWHAGEINRAAYPSAQGFDSSFGFLSQWMLQGPDDGGRPQLKSPTYLNPWLLDEQAHYRQYAGHLEDILAEHTIQLLQQNTNKPWFIYHATLAPHAPLEPSTAFAQAFPPTAEGKHLAMLAQLDHNLQKILAALQASGQWDNTIIIFASDNGSQTRGSLAKQGNSNAPFAGGKANYDEGGIRAPLLIKWHTALEGRNRLREDPVSIMDIYASLRAVLGEGDTAHALDGRASLLPDASPSLIPSLNVFYSFDALSFFDQSGTQRLIREWNGEQTTRSELLHYDQQARPAMLRNLFWMRWLAGDARREAALLDQFLAWRNQVRQVAVQVTTLPDATTQITGSDFLRTPVNPAYALAFAFTPKDVVSKQRLLTQEGIMDVVLEGGTLSARVHGLQVQAEGIHPGQCYRVVLSGAFYDRYSTVRGTTLPSQLHLVVEGVLRDSAEAVIDSLGELAIQTPHLARGMTPPIFFSSQLLPDEESLPSGLDTELAGLSGSCQH